MCRVRFRGCSGFARIVITAVCSLLLIAGQPPLTVWRAVLVRGLVFLFR